MTTRNPIRILLVPSALIVAGLSLPAHAAAPAGKPVVLTKAPGTGIPATHADKETPADKDADQKTDKTAEADTDDEPDNDADIATSDNRIRSLVYDPNDVYAISTRVGYASYIEFAPREDIDTISVGERSFWQLIPSGNRLFIRPLKNDISTNMTIITNKHAYQFDLKSVSNPKKKIIYVARFTYPEEEKATARQIQIERISNPFKPQPTPMPPPMGSMPLPPPPGPNGFAPPPPLPPVTPESVKPPIVLHDASPPFRETELPPLDKRNYHYSLSGPDAVAPFEVFDDGNTTYFRYNPPAANPPLAGVVEKDGTESAVTVYQNGTYFAVDVIASKIALHTPEGSAYIYNDNLPPTP